jgi:hypothetical protein
MKLKAVKTGVAANIAPTHHTLTTVKDVNSDIIAITRKGSHLRTMCVKVLLAQNRKQRISRIIGTIATLRKIFGSHNKLLFGFNTNNGSKRGPH